MEREWLERELGEGRSIESLAREAGRPASTVAYWVSKYGLVSTHAARHAARGGIERDALAALVARGMSVRAIAAEVGVSYATVQHWLRRHGLKTARAERLAASVRDAPGALVDGHCERHGRALFARRREGGLRCLRCRSEAVAARRRRVKALLVEAAGGSCVLCGYDRSPAALQFHRVDRSSKAFSLAAGGLARSLESALAEAAKCVLLCATCHAEVEAGVATLRDDPADHSCG